MNGKDHSKDLTVDWRIIRKLPLEKQTGGLDTGFIFPRACKQRLTSVNMTMNIHVT